MIDFGELIPIAGILGGLGFAWIAYKYRELTITNRQTTEEAAREAAEKHRLERRLAVLEKIVTDRGIDTADQIEALRERNDEQLR